MSTIWSCCSFIMASFWSRSAASRLRRSASSRCCSSSLARLSSSLRASSRCRSSSARRRSSSLRTSSRRFSSSWRRRFSSSRFRFCCSREKQMMTIEGRSGCQQHKPLASRAPFSSWPPPSRAVAVASPAPASPVRPSPSPASTENTKHTMSKRTAYRYMYSTASFSNLFCLLQLLILNLLQRLGFSALLDVPNTCRFPPGVR